MSTDDPTTGRRAGRTSRPARLPVGRAAGPVAGLPALDHGLITAVAMWAIVAPDRPGRCIA